MTWLWLILLSVGLYSVATIVNRVLMQGKESDPTAYMIVFQFLCSLLIAVYLLVVGVDFPNITGVLGNLILNGALISVASLAMFKALKFTEASEYTILNTSSVFWSLIASALFLHELITANKIVGTLMIILGVILVTWRPRKHRLVLHQGHFYTLLSATAFGLAFTNEAYIVGQIGVLQNLVIGFFLPGFLVLLVRPKAVKKMSLLLRPKNMFNMTIFSLFYLMGAITIFASYRAGGEATKIYPISNLSVITTVILAAIFLKERKHLPRKLIGALVAFAGLWFLQ